MNPALRAGKDGVFSARAVFIDAESLAPANRSIRRDLETLARFFRIVVVGKTRAGVPMEKGGFCTVGGAKDVPEFALRSSIELYASWFIGKAPEHVFKGVLAGGESTRVAGAIKAIQTAEAASRIIIDEDRLARLVASLRKKDARIVFTNGVFDLVHIGHVRLLEMARRLGDVLIVGINSDDSTRKIKGDSRPVVPQFARAETLVEMRSVDYCSIFTETDPMRLLALIQPDVLAKGSDYSLRRVVGARYVAGYGGSVVRLPLVPGCSTTAMITRIHARRRQREEGRRSGA
jgi:D-beta-D-heptose 7-phosphate kinase/D-beta-D-heptose 1-phosphate adenosyltransferase